MYVANDYLKLWQAPKVEQLRPRQVTSLPICRYGELTSKDCADRNLVLSGIFPAGLLWWFWIGARRNSSLGNWLRDPGHVAQSARRHGIAQKPSETLRSVSITFAAGLISFELISYHFAKTGVVSGFWIPVFLALSTGFGRYRQPSPWQAFRSTGFTVPISQPTP